MSEINDKENTAFQEIDTTEAVEVPVEDNNKSNNLYKEVLSYLILIVVAFVLAQVIHRYLFTPVTVIGESMEPTIIGETNTKVGDRILLSRVAKIDRFDIIVFDVPHKDEPYIKRVIGLPGDNVYMEKYKLYINGELIDETYLDKNPIYTGLEYARGHTSFTLDQICAITGVNCQVDGKTVIPEGYYLVLGDNRNNSEDSRMIGLIHKDDIIGQALFVFYPLNRFGKSFG